MVTTMFLVGCVSTSPPKVDIPNYRKPSSKASTLKLKNDTIISSESKLKELAAKLPKSTISKKEGVFVWDLKGGVLDGKNQKGDGSQNEDQEPLFRARISLVVKNGFVKNNKNAAVFYYPNSGIEKLTFTNIGEDAVATAEGAKNFVVKNCEFINDREGDKSIQLNEGRGAVVEDNLVVSGITGVRVFESSFTPSSATAEAGGNTFVGTDTAFNVAKGTLIIGKQNKYDKVKTPFKTAYGGKIKNADK